MKPKDYVKKYNLESSEYFDHSSFIADLTVDFQSLIEFQKSVGQYSYSHFENIIKQIKQKFDSISFKSKMNHEKWEKLWKFFYASVVTKVKDNDFGDLIEKQRKAKQSEWERRNRWKGAYWANNSSDFSGTFKFDFSWMFEEMFKTFFRDGFNVGSDGLHVGAPVKDFGELGLIPENSTLEDVDREFRKLALLYHPDKGGDAERFKVILEAKNRCKLYLQRGV